MLLLAAVFPLYNSVPETSKEKSRKYVEHKFWDECIIAPYLTLWRRFLLEKLIISNLIKKFPDFPET
jgi:hypothetical protein